jgi:hypothetical protein
LKQIEQQMVPWRNYVGSILPLNCGKNNSGARRVEELCSADVQVDGMKDVTATLAAIEGGDRNAPEQLLVLVYDELRRLAASRLAQESPGQTLQPTALVHEAWLRLVGDQNPSFNDRTHFFRASAEAMRRILIDRARRRKTQRHGGGYPGGANDALHPARLTVGNTNGWRVFTPETNKP